jgi:translation elongation factor EF-Tu-like GTPase
MEMRNHPLYALVLVACAVLSAGCSPKEDPVTFRLPVQHVFYIKTLDRVIVTGVIDAGSVRAGDQLAVQTAAGVIPVVVDKLEHPKKENVFEARAGEDIGLMLQGITKEQVASGDVVVAREQGH